MPSGSDDASALVRRKLEEHHLKVYGHAQSHTYATLSMDANETDRLQGRRTRPAGDLSVNYRYSGSARTPTYTCYIDELTDAHLMHNPGAQSRNVLSLRVP
jgi:hypothetical protein